MEECEELIIKQQTLKEFHDEKINTVLKAYPPDKGFNVEVISCDPIDARTENITFRIKWVKKQDKNKSFY
jgi:hypothetical protein